MVWTAEKEARLRALWAAYDALISGKTVVEATINNKTVKYGPGDKSSLKSEIEIAESEKRSGGRTRGAIRFRIG